jgi:hypothetical protein
MYGQPEPLGTPPQPCQKTLAIRVVAKDRPPLIAAVEHVVERIFLANPPRS